VICRESSSPESRKAGQPTVPNNGGRSTDESLLHLGNRVQRDQSEKPDMSKRFGRNQKRRLVQQVESLTLAHKRESALARQLSRNLQQASESLALVAEVFGKNFAALPLSSMWVDHLGQQIRIAKPISQPAALSSRFDMPATVALQTQYIEAMAPRCDIDKLSGQMHFRLQTPDGQVAYGLTREAWMHMPREHIAGLVADEIRAFLVRKIS